MGPLDPPILITGAPRSGTSMVAGIFDLCGAFGGHTSGPTRNNPRGMFENAEVRNRIVKPYLRANNWDPLCQNPLPDPSRLPPLPLREWVSGIFLQQGYTGGPWYYKGAKMSFLWPLWDDAFPDAEWVIVRRDRGQIAASCMRTAFMRAYRTKAEWETWVERHEEQFESMQDCFGSRCREVWSQRIVDGDFTRAQDTVESVGLTWDGKRVRDFVDASI